MSVGNGKEPGDIRIRNKYASTPRSRLKQVVATGDVARAMWRLLLADECGQPVVRVQLSRWREDALPRQAAETARGVIDSSRQWHERRWTCTCWRATPVPSLALPVPTGAAAVLTYLASLHERLGYAEDALRLIDTAETEDVSERGRQALAIARACTGSLEQRHQDARGHHAGSRPDARDRSRDEEGRVGDG